MFVPVPEKRYRSATLPAARSVHRSDLEAIVRHERCDKVTLLNNASIKNLKKRIARTSLRSSASVIGIP